MVVDDHAMVRAGLEQLLDGVADMSVVASAADGSSAIDMIAQAHPDVVLMDLSMPGIDGIEATRRIVAEHPAARVVILTSFSDRERILRALDAGAAGYLLKDAETEELLRGIRAAAAGEAPLAPKAATAVLGDRRPPALTAREQEVLSAVVAGLANKQIARRLGISEKTVKAHLTNIFQRIGVADRTQAALWAERHGITAG
jgi:DNA-binding NarL/FixJ family response regulator